MTEVTIIYHLLSKSMDWFLYDRDLRHDRVNKNSFIKNPEVEKSLKKELSRNYTPAHMQTDLRIPPTKVFFFQTRTVSFPPFFNVMLYLRISQKIT